MLNSSTGYGFSFKPSNCKFRLLRQADQGYRSDDAYKGGGGTGDGWETHRLETFTLDATDGVTDSKWYHLCVSIQRCNLALKNLKALSAEDMPQRDCRIAEMNVLRAHYFFELQRMFNQIPWFDETMSDSEVAKTPNNVYSREQLLDKIADEIRTAAEVLPETQPQVGRVNKYMANAYLAKVLLYRAYEQDPETHAVVNMNADALNEVADLCEDIRTSTKYDLFENFEDLDLVAKDNGKECIWDIQFSMHDGSASAGRVNWSNLLNTPQGPYNGDGFFLPSQDLINAYQTDDDGLPVFDYQSLPDFAKVTLEGDKSVITNYDHNVDPLSKEQARQALRTETRLECAMEGERFFDLVRWGIAADVMNKYIAKEKASRVYYQGAQFTSGRDEYLPITNNQYKFSGKNYVQNPGYAAF
ncbi:MAG: RagB/SusD family nutrient uptake outer membrane protein [Rikenellaceae bacterium]|nr:RagB/SusD family nutrient uptake outer membrane protein [Rikenellaceae bacterium]